MAQVKTDAEIEKIKKACRVAAAVLDEVSKHVRAGVKTSALEQIADEMIRAKGAIPAFKGYRGYKYSTCLSVNEEVVHGLPGNRELKEGDIIGVDVGAIVEGYYGDNAATFPVGKVSAKLKKLMSVTKDALYKGIAEARAGKHLGDISNAIYEEAEKFGFSVVRDLYGHGVGSSLHEDPLIPNFGKKGSGIELKAGMTLAIEPMLNIGGSEIKTLGDGWTIVTADKSISAHFEHTILVTDGLPIILTKKG
jgi:methionyl aminopeptidase